MNVLLISCPIWGGGSKGPPLVLATLTAFLRQQGCKIEPLDIDRELRNENKLKYWLMHRLYKVYIPEFTRLIDSINLLYGSFYDKIADEIIRKNPKIVAFSVYRSNFRQSICIARRIKKLNPKIIIVFGGGYHREDYFFDKILAKENCVNIVVKGEGELTLLEIIKSLNKYNKVLLVKGTITKLKEKMIEIENWPVLKDLNTLPCPDFSDFNMEEYNTIPYLMSRGCVNKCTFCDEQVLHKGYRHKSADKIYSDLKFLTNKYGIKQIHFYDAAINSDKRKLERLCDLLIKNNMDFKWMGFAKCNNLELDFLKKMGKAGCVKLIYGVESGSQKIMDIMGKGYRVEEVEAILKQTHAAGIRSWVNFMTGYPQENWRDFFDTVKFFTRNKGYIETTVISSTSLHTTNPVPDGQKHRIKRIGFFWYTHPMDILVRFIRYLLLLFIVRVNKK